MSLFLGSGVGVDGALRDEIAEELATCLERYRKSGSSVDLLAASAALQKAGGWNDLRAAEPWSLAAAAAVECSNRSDLDNAPRRALLDLAAALLEAPSQRVRGILPQRILEGLVVHHLS